MRLIDADALKEEIEFHPTSVSVCMTAAEAKGQTYFKNRCLEDIADAPTIDAIPVEWLCEKIRYEEKFGGIPFGEYIKVLIWDWHQQEQEAR